ncbi:MAG: DNA-directed RNA polymerase subunit beta', partial [Calditrichaeota bacterium]|nr:DNA-directed RNA polymerase subunit beta' [Calditrichota bacterium]
MAIELFKPFIIRRLLDQMKAPTVKKAKRIIEDAPSFVWEILEEIVQAHPILLNRAPTLHRLGIQAFQPLLVEGKSIQLHPLVCSAFNADFDGDQMAVHVPLSFEAQLEAKYLMLANQNILHPASGRPITVPSQDMVLGCYYMTKMRPGRRGEDKKFGDLDQLRAALHHGSLELHAKIQFRLENGTHVETTPGRVLFNQIIPAKVRGRHFFNEAMGKKALEKLIFTVFHSVGHGITANFLDELKKLGFTEATRSGTSIGLSNILIPDEKHTIIDKAQKEVDEIQEAFQMGFMRDGERYNKVIDTWNHASIRLSKVLNRKLAEDQDGFNPMFMMADSGARGSNDQIKQLAGMRGLMAKPQKRLTGGKGEIIESPITANFKEGLSVLEYFISTHGARKGLADTALKTADAGYLTRRLVDVAQDVIIRAHDCGTIMGIEVEALKEGEEVTEQLHDRILGRVLAEDLTDPASGAMVAEADTMVDEELAEKIANLVIDRVRIRSVLTCELQSGVCGLCYGRNLTTNDLVHVGEAVGVMAAQSIGEPGTQLTLRTFHIGGAASLASKDAEIKARHNGRVHFEEIHTTERNDGVRVTNRRNGEILIVDAKENRALAKYNVPYGAEIKVEDGQQIKEGTTIYEWDPHNVTILSPASGLVKFENMQPDVTYREEIDEVSEKKTLVIIDSKNRKLTPMVLIVDEKGNKVGSTIPPVGSHLMVKEGDSISQGAALIKKPRESAKNKDITGGLPRVAELFEARKPKDPAVITEIDGKVKTGEIKANFREITVVPDFADARTYKVPAAKHVEVHDGEVVRAGDNLSEGNSVPQDILKILGPNKVQEYLLNQIQDVYRTQGVTINDKHIEVIIRQMMQKVRITEPGDTEYLENDMVDKHRFFHQNEEIHNMVVVEEVGDSSFRLGAVITRERLADELNRISNEGGVEPTTRPAEPAIYEPV